MNREEIKHTPGPWWVEGGDPDAASWAARWPNIHADGYEVVGAQGLYGDYDTDMANARLIAAAPDLLEALRDFSAYVHAEQSATDGDVRYSNTQINRLVFKARAAIAKATGE
jgi:hypothetical protein